MLIQCVSYADESLPGYLHRRAEANGLDGGLVIELFKSSNDGDDTSLPQNLARRPWWAGIAGQLRCPLTRPMPLWNIRRRRFCAQCLIEEPYWRAAWDLSLVTACWRHKTRLAESCPHCSAHLSWHLHAIDRCPACLKSLYKVEMLQLDADDDELWLAKELTQRLIGSNRHRSAHTKHLSLGAFHELVFRLGACSVRPKARKPLKVAGSDHLDVTIPIALAGAGLLRNWTHGFFTALDKIRRERGVAYQWQLGTALGPIYYEIFEGLADPDYLFVRDAFEAYLLEHWEAPLTLRYKQLSREVIEGHRWQPIEKIANQTNVDPSFILRLVDTGQIASREINYDGGRTDRVIDAVELTKVAPELRSTLTVAQAAEMLGVKRSRISQLISAGIIQIWGGAPAQGAHWRLRRTSIEAIAECGQVVPFLSGIGDGQVSVNYLLRYRVNEEKVFQAFMSGILSGEITIVGVGSHRRQIRDWIVEKAEVGKLLYEASSRNSNDLTVIDTANELKVKQEVAYALVRNGLIKSRQVVAGKATALMVTNHAIAAFRRKYIFGSELAKTLKTSPKSILPLLRDKGIHPAAGPTVATRFCRQYVWPRSTRLEDVISMKANNS